MSSLVKNLIFALGLAILLWLGYSIFIQQDDDELLSSSGGDFTSQEASREIQEFRARLNSIESVQMDGSIFSDQRFASLFDFRQELVDEPSGRKNPFAPVE